MVGEKAMSEFRAIGSALDSAVREEARTNGLKASQVRYLRPSRVIAGFGDDFVHVAMTDLNAGSGGRHSYSSVPPSVTGQDVVAFAEDELGLESPYGFSIPNGILSDLSRHAEWSTRMARAIVANAVEQRDQQARIVRLNPIFRGRNFTLDSTLVFTLSPFKEPYNRIFADVVRPTVESITPLRCLRADDINDNSAIIEDIWRKINEARIVLADISEGNPNVFYELGIAHTVGKDAVLLLRDGERAPFDLTHLRHISYRDTSDGLKRLADELRSTIGAILARPSSDPS